MHKAVQIEMQKSQFALILIKVMLLHVAAQRKKDLFTSAKCPPVAEGEDARITFNTERPVSSPFSEAIVYVKRNNGPDLLRCYLGAQELMSECESFSVGLRTDGLVDSKLTIVISNASKADQGLYVLHSVFNDGMHDPISCNFNILDGGEETGRHGTGGDNSGIIAAVLTPSALCLIAICLFVLWRRRKLKRRENQTHSVSMNCESGGHDQKHSLLEPEIDGLQFIDENHDAAAEVSEEKIEASTSLDKKNEFTDLEEIKKIERNQLLHEGSGSFLIRDNPLQNTYYVLAVNHNGKEELFALRKEENGVVLEAAGMSFKSLSDLVKYYTENEIRTSKGHVCCKLTNDVTRDLQKEGSQEQKEHQQEQVKSGSLYFDSTHFAVDSKCATSKNAHSVEDVSTDNNMSSGIAGRIQTPRQEEPQTTDRPVSPMSPSSQEAACALTPTTDVHSEEDPYSDNSIPRQEEPPTTDRPVSSMSPSNQEAACALTPTTDDHSERAPYSDSSIGYLEDVQSRAADRKLLRDNGRGSFLIRPSDKGPHKVLAVNFYGNFHYFTIVQEGANFVLQETGETFTSPLKLVEYYKENAIKPLKGKPFGTLSHPCTKNKEKGPKTEVTSDKNHPVSPAGQKETSQVFQATDDEHCDKDLTTGSKTLKTSGEPIECEMKGNTSSDATRLEQLVNIRTVTPNESSTPRESSV